MTNEVSASPATLREGSEGPPVRWLQALLINHGFSAGEPDAKFGPKTKQKVMEFQRAKGLGADGIVGPKTWAALGAPPMSPGPTTGGVSEQQLRSIMPNLSAGRAREVLPHFNKASAEAGINTPKRQAAFLAQLAVESGEFLDFEERASGEAYEGRTDLGNIHPGDGVRYKGRGPIQLTGRNNYRAAGQGVGLDLEGNPRQAAEVEVGFRTAAWFWNSRSLSPLADVGNFREITRRINGGTNGLAARERYYARAKQVLGA
ncbi:MAG TPA: peptidoglycan-binding protein [Myxococcaceae bacterium]|jgi:putative chitinase